MGMDHTFSCYPCNHEANPDLGTELFGGSATSEGLLSSPGTVSLAALRTAQLQWCCHWVFREAPQTLTGLNFYIVFCHCCYFPISTCPRISYQFTLVTLPLWPSLVFPQKKQKMERVFELFSCLFLRLVFDVCLTCFLLLTEKIAF